jgi:hypothetical protein
LAASNSVSPNTSAPSNEDEEYPTEETALVPRKPKTLLNDSIEEFMAMYANDFIYYD